MAVTLYRLAEEILKMLSGGKIPTASGVSLNELKISICQVCNSLLKIDYFQTNAKWGEMIPNGTVLGLYENIPVTQVRNRSQAALPVKPIKLPRNMGVWSVFPTEQPDREFIPVEMGQWGLLQSQPLINNLLGQVGYEVYGNQVLFTRDITIPSENVTVGMRLMILDFSQYGDFDPLPILPEMEWQIKQEVLKLYGGEPIPDKTVDPTSNEQKGVPLKQQSQA